MAGLIVLGMMTSGCATMIHGTTQKIDITTEPSGATVKILGVNTETNGATLKVIGQPITTPGSVELTRHDFYTFLVSKDGYKTTRISLNHKLSPAAIPDILLGLGLFPIGLIVPLIDDKNGASFDLTPANIDVVLKKISSGITSIEPNDADIIERPEISKADLFSPLIDEKRTRICLLYTQPYDLPVRVRDGIEVIGLIRNKGYICWERKPGPVKVFLTSNRGLAFDLIAQGGKTYFLKQSQGIFTDGKIESISEQSANTTLLDCPPQNKGNYVPME
jgi:hypothetical protein